MPSTSTVRFKVYFEIPAVVRDAKGNLSKGIKAVDEVGEGLTQKGAILDAKRKANLGAVRNVKVIKIEEA